MISIIVPVFGVEPFLDECVLSLLRQTYEDLEIILVDDGSPDCCDKICDHYASFDPRIRVIHKKNGGPSDARNAGLDVARGEYIGFVDSDDYVAADMFSFLHSLMESTGSDVSICGHVKTSHKGRPRLYFHHRKIINMDSQTAIKKMLQLGLYESFTWNKLYRRDLFDTIRFPSGHIHEDLYTIYKIFHKADIISYSKEIKYYYRQRIGSIIHSIYNPKYYDYIDASIEVRDFVEENYPQILQTAKFACFRARLFTVFNLLVARPQMLFKHQKRRENLYRYIRSIMSSMK